MKKNAALIAGIMFVAGCASSPNQRAYYNSGTYDSSHLNSSAVVTSGHAYNENDMSADSTKRGGSLDARGYDQDANYDEVEGAPEALNPGKKADSSVRGGSIFAREREWNHDSEPSSGIRDADRHMKADSSIRGGSVEARGARDAGGNYESDVDSESNFHSSYPHATQDNFVQGSSATWTTEINNNASVGGAASGEIGEGSSSLSLEEQRSERAVSSSSDEFESNDPAMHRAGSPLGTAGGEPNFLYQDNRAHGVGSATSGDFAKSPVNQSAIINDDQLAQRVKSSLTSESTATHGLMSSEVARNIQVSAANGEITLTGTVPSEKHKDLIEIRAREISGVQNVKNELMVTPEADAASRNLSRGSDLEDVTSELQD